MRVGDIAVMNPETAKNLAGVLWCDLQCQRSLIFSGEDLVSGKRIRFIKRRNMKRVSFVASD